MIITPMLSCHVPAVAALEKASFSTPWSEKSIGEELNNEWAIWYVALEEETLLAVASVKPGAGERILHTLMSLIEGRPMILEVASTNTRALRLYEKLGFLPVAEVSRWYEV